MLEKEVEQFLMRQVHKLGGRCYKWSSQSNRGVCDRIVLLNGQIWFIELKSPKGRLSSLQVMFGQIITQYTSNYRVIYSKRQVMELIDEICPSQLSK